MAILELLSAVVVLSATLCGCQVANQEPPHQLTETQTDMVTTTSYEDPPFYNEDAPYIRETPPALVGTDLECYQHMFFTKEELGYKDCEETRRDGGIVWDCPREHGEGTARRLLQYPFDGNAAPVQSSDCTSCMYHYGPKESFVVNNIIWKPVQLTGLYQTKLLGICGPDESGTNYTAQRAVLARNNSGQLKMAFRNFPHFCKCQ